MRCDAEGALQVGSRVVPGSLVEEFVAADGDVAGVGMPVLPNAQDHLRVGGLGVEYADSVVRKLQAVIDAATTGVALHANVGGEVTAARVTDSGALDVDGVARDDLVGT